MARTDWQYVNGSTNNTSVFFAGIRWRYRDDLFGQSGYPESRIASNTDIIEYQPYIGRKQSYNTFSYTSWKSSKYRYSYNTTSGSDPAAATNELGISTTFRFDKASNNTKYYPVTGALSAGNVFNTSSSTLSRIIQVPHCSDGTSKLRLYFYVAGDSNTAFSWAETNQIVILEGIPRYTTINSFTVSKRNETSFTFNWSTADTIDYAWYSTNNGSSWTGYDVADGTSGNFPVSGLSPNTTYTCKLRVRRKDSQLNTDSSSVSQTTNAVPTQSLADKSETTIKMNWSCDANVDYVWYSKDNGSNWTAVGSVSGTSGNYTISSLSANTSYNIKTRVRRSATQTTYDTSASSQTTYQYPYVSAVSSSNLTIGNSQTLTLYNPKGRNCTVYMKKDSASGTQLYSGTTDGTSITFTPTASTLYSSIPSAKYGNCVYYCVYSNQHVSTSTGHKYIVNETTNAPEMSASSLKDTNSATITLTGSDSKIVLNASTLLISVTGLAKNSASVSSISIDGSSRTISNNTATLTISNPTKTSYAVIITDSRGIAFQTTVEIASGNVINYIPLTMTGVAKRNQPTDGIINISSSGKYYNGSFGSQSNTLTTTYNWRESGGSWQQNWTTLTNTTSTGTHNEAQIQLTNKDYAKSYEIQFKAQDKLNTITSTITVSKGEPVYWWNNDGLYVNGQFYTKDMQTNNTSDTWVPVWKNGKLEHRVISADLNNRGVKTLSSVSHSDYGTNNNYLPDMSFIAYWNGAYNSSNNSNLKYCSGGTIAKTSDIPTNSSFTLAGLGEKSYNSLTNKPTIPTVNNAKLTIKRNGTTVTTFTANQSSDTTADISVPTLPTTTSGTGIVTRSSGATLNGSEYRKYGNVVELLITLTSSGNTSVGGDCFKGTINNSGFYPPLGVTSANYNGSTCIIGSIGSDGSITCRVTGATLSSGKGFGMRFTYVIN